VILLPACGGASNPYLGPAARAWAEGPVRWLILPAELREFARLRGDGEMARFVEEFWLRRDPDPAAEGNPARERFEARVAAADDLYGEAGLRGSLTDRGRALVLLGPPSLLRSARRNTPAWRPARSAGDPMPVRQVAVETWEYRRDDLPPALRALLDGRADTVALTFQLGDRARLIEGEGYLVLAAQATVRLP
jgi:GWxTD domain-containing protein